MTRGKYVAPSITLNAFSCAHCGTLADQKWLVVHAEPVKAKGTPVFSSPGEHRVLTEEDIPNEVQRRRMNEYFRKLETGQPFLHFERANIDYHLPNVSVSECYSCRAISLWIRERLVFPDMNVVVDPNPDMPETVRLEYLEAAAIVDRSPRGAAALLRLAVQKLCAELGEAGENINEDIAALVRKGLDVRVQQALDVLRVVGNNAVHPGQMDLRDDPATAQQLFGLLNLIVERMISIPKHVDGIFQTLPQSAREQIERRNTKALGPPKPTDQ